MIGFRRHLRVMKFTWLWGLFWAAGFAWADPVPMSAGGQPTAIGSDIVAILEETLSIDVHFRDMKVEVGLRLESQRELPDFTMGFPCSNREDPLVGALSCKTRLSVREDGVQKKLIRKKTGPETEHWVWTAHFKPSKPIRVDVSYTQPMVNDRYDIPLAGTGALIYQLSTGANWAGPIHKLDVRVSLPVETVVAIWPPGYIRKAGQIRWSLADFKPSGDLIVLLMPVETSRYLSAFHAKDYATLQKNRKAGVYDHRRIQELAARLTRDHAELYREALSLWSLMPAIRSMPMPSPQSVRDCLEESARFMLSE